MQDIGHVYQRRDSLPPTRYRGAFSVVAIARARYSLDRWTSGDDTSEEKVQQVLRTVEDGSLDGEDPLSSEGTEGGE
jgi:hypothetical protein